ncbi:hypothetical protein [Nitrospirillum iridis]|uniref:Uncharacterized protein n=1 Tax=Nitrospirillum iridis TaxID=765888 RepID=A0A7X0AZK8_9PROT|nr:hypothetical protein [Nitrospirillum iridis]MBB6253039.1 hypothetical protein [Nitrospirillum iridis]
MGYTIMRGPGPIDFGTAEGLTNGTWFVDTDDDLCLRTNQGVVYFKSDWVGTVDDPWEVLVKEILPDGSRVTFTQGDRE